MSGACIVTGAAGFIGSHLVDRLLASGQRVVGVDNLSLGRRSHLAQAMRMASFEFRELDVNDYDKLLATARESHARHPIDTLWHLAANSDIQAGAARPEVDLRSTFLTTFHALKLAHDLQIPHFAFASTSAVYGVQKGLLTEDGGPWFPISTYGAMKLASEATITASLERHLRRAWIFRFPNVVGSRATHGALYDFIRKLRKNPSELEVLGDGTQEKPYLHVSELIDAMMHLRERAQDRLNYHNIAPRDTVTTVRHMAESAVRLAAPGARIRYTGGDRGWVGDVPKFAYSIQKIERAGWSPRMTSNEAVERALQEIATENPA
ncbi:MAG: SDR family NAD(P)-dependent oxidoreductase [Verrucomicrobia bacterium]|nr:SDR family NAD(P)-dependent oxidoreductase [Verrucomicrobiota bacterium]MBI3868196.1 SDR family NAD(P)-dependent oxidoreductase [Verrucomicrobiota bacterium]